MKTYFEKYLFELKNVLRNPKYVIDIESFDFDNIFGEETLGNFIDLFNYDVQQFKDEKSLSNLSMK